MKLDNGAVSLTVTPGTGARLTELVDLERGRSWLASWDELRPTIAACRYPDQGSHAGTPLAAGGDVVDAAWQLDEHDDVVQTRVQVRSLPLRLVRRVELVPDAPVVHVGYALEHDGDEPLRFLWAARARLRAGEDTRLTLPPEVTEVVQLSTDRGPDEVGLVAWPHLPRAAGAPLDRLEPGGEPWTSAFALPPTGRISWARLDDPAAAAGITLRWSGEVLRYLQFELDNGTGTIAILPRTAHGDDLSDAVRLDRAAMISPGETISWGISIELHGSRAAPA